MLRALGVAQTIVNDDVERAYAELVDFLAEDIRQAQSRGA